MLYTCIGVLCKNNLSNKGSDCITSTGEGAWVTTMGLFQKVTDNVSVEEPVCHLGAKHDLILVLPDGSCKPWPQLKSDGRVHVHVTSKIRWLASNLHAWPGA